MPVRAISGEYPLSRRAQVWDLSWRASNLNHLFLWNSRGVRAQDYPECDRDELNTDVCLGPPRCFARGLE